MLIEQEINIQAPTEKVWHIIGQEFGDCARWASTLATSAPIGKPGPNGAPCTGRKCETNNGMGGFTETLTMYSETSKSLSYDAKGDKMPGFVKGLSNHWQLKQGNNGQTQLTAKMQLTIAFPFNIFPGPMMKSKMSKMLKVSLEELKYFSEFDRAHPRKN